jgi:hypothetical protein
MGFNSGLKELNTVMPYVAQFCAEGWALPAMTSDRYSAQQCDAGTLGRLCVSHNYRPFFKTKFCRCPVRPCLALKLWDGVWVAEDGAHCDCSVLEWRHIVLYSMWLGHFGWNWYRHTTRCISEDRSGTWEQIYEAKAQSLFFSKLQALVACEGGAVDVKLHTCSKSIL